MHSKLFGILVALSLFTCNAATGLADTDPVNWDHTAIAMITLTNARFNPQTTILPLDEPVRLTFRNGTGTTHDFVTSFFSAVSQRSSAMKGGTRVVLQPADRVTYFIIPQKKGLYALNTIMRLPPGAIPAAIIEVK